MSTTIQPLGGETYLHTQDQQGNTLTLTYNDLWAMIVCRRVFEGDWTRMRKVVRMVEHPHRKHAIIDRLARLDHSLPELPEPVVQMHLRHAHIWFNQLPVYNAKNV